MTEDDRYDYEAGDPIEIPANHTFRYFAVAIMFAVLAVLVAEPVRMAYHDRIIREATRIAARRMIPKPSVEYAPGAEDAATEYTCSTGGAWSNGWTIVIPGDKESQ